MQEPAELKRFGFDFGGPRAELNPIYTSKNIEARIKGNFDPSQTLGYAVTQLAKRALEKGVIISKGDTVGIVMGRQKYLLEFNEKMLSNDIPIGDAYNIGTIVLEKYQTNTISIFTNP